MFSVRTLYSLNACIVFVGMVGPSSSSCRASTGTSTRSPSVCMTIGIPLDGSYGRGPDPWEPPQADCDCAGTLVLGALAAAYFFPAPGGQ